MTTKVPPVKPENLPVAERIRAGMAAFGYSARGANKDFADRYIGDRNKSPMVSDWRKGRYLPEADKLQAMAADWSTTFEWLRFGRGAPPAWYGGETKPTPIFTRERRADDDVTAMRLALLAVAETLLRKTPDAADYFRAYLSALARAENFSSRPALLGALDGIAEQVQADQEVVSRGRRRGASARSTKQGK